MTEMTKDERERLKGLAEKATPGPWKACPSREDDFYGVYPDTGKAEFPIAKMPEIIRSELNEANAAFIAAFNPQTALSVLAALSAREAELAEATQALEDVCSPLGKIRREAEASGRQLSHQAYVIANSLEFVQSIARAALSPKGGETKDPDADHCQSDPSGPGPGGGRRLPPTPQRTRP